MDIKIKETPLPKDPQEAFDTGFMSGCVTVTSLLSEHPESWDGPCNCEECQDEAQQVQY